MTTVGIRELKNRLSAYIRQVAAGAELRVTDRGRVVAELTPPRPYPHMSEKSALEGLAHRGLLTPPMAKPMSYPLLPPVLTRETSSKLLDAERGAA